LNRVQGLGFGVRAAGVIDCLDIATGSVLAVVGCGGKTSLIELVASGLREKKVLISTTTKIFPPKMKDIMLCETLSQCEKHEPQTGIQCMGLLNSASGKLEALPEAFLARLQPGYDVVLLEADGSRGLPCKGWLANEPVIPNYCTYTLGVITMGALDKPAGEATVQRLPEFYALTGVGEGQAITAQALEAMVCAPSGMFKNSAGQRYVIVNQVEDDETAKTALAFLRTIKEKFPARFKKLLYGSVHYDVWREP
jgi:probable selenium-dependent hydroxylase accessory protein YqeC